MRSSSGVSSPLLALLLVFISLIWTCMSAPTKSSETTLRSDTEHGLMARGMTYPEIHEAYNDPNTPLVSPGEAKWASPKNGDKFIASGGFDGCVGVIIVTTQGAIVAHYQPQLEKEGALKVPELPEQIEEHYSELGGGKAFVFGSTFEGEYEYPWQIEEVTSFLETELEEGYPIIQTKYMNTAEYALRDIDFGAMMEAKSYTINTILVEFPDDAAPVVYIEGESAPE